MKYEPFPYQEYAANAIIKNPSALLWLDMGLGKTCITLTAIRELMYNRFEVYKCLIVAPKKVAEATWQNEILKWDHLSVLKFSTVLGNPQKRIKALNTPASVYIINRENIPWLVEYFRNRWPFDMVVLDEASSFKNPQAQRFKALKSVRCKIKRIVELTGTPSPNGLIDLWAQVFLADGGQRLGTKIGVFRERWFVPDKRNREIIFSYKPRNGAEQEIKTLLSDICISMKSEDYLTLPELIQADVPVVLNAEARRMYETIERTMLLTVDENTIEAVTAASLYGKLLQLANGAVYDETHNAIEIHGCKLEALYELIEALNGEHAIIYYCYQHDIPRIIQKLAPLKLRIEKYADSRQAEKWNNGEIDILLAHPASVAYGLNLQYGGNHIVWFGKSTSLELTLQANKRLHRQGQTKPVIVHSLIVEDSAEEDVVKSLEDKDKTEQALLISLKARVMKVKEGANNAEKKSVPRGC